jgi:hypothetical protein
MIHDANVNLTIKSKDFLPANMKKITTENRWGFNLLVGDGRKDWAG